MQAALRSYRDLLLDAEASETLRRMSSKPTRPVRTAAEVDRIVTWVGGGCGAAAAAGGFFVGFAYTLDQGDRALAPLFGVLGLVVGALLGLLNAIAPIVVLAAVNGRRWAAAMPLRAVLAGIAAALPIGVLNLLSDPSSAWLILCTVVTAFPAAIATICLDWRTTSTPRSALAQTAV